MCSIFAHIKSAIIVVTLSLHMISYLVDGFSNRGWHATIHQLILSGSGDAVVTLISLLTLKMRMVNVMQRCSCLQAAQE